MMWWGSGADPLAMGIGLVVMLLFWAAIVWGVVYAVRSATAGRGRGVTDRGAKDILDERFARGEIDEEEYLTRREALAR